MRRDHASTTMEHRAYPFDYEGFTRDLRADLDAALATGDCTRLRAFIQANGSRLRDPRTGEPLELSWETRVEPKDAHQYGNLALTRFYDPEEDVGLGNDWDDLNDLLNELLGEAARPTLGEPCGPPDNPFDPGQQGAFFQSPEQVKASLRQIEQLLSNQPGLAVELGEARAMLAPVAGANLGLYVTLGPGWGINR
jgi:hypothetical protein